MSSLFRIVRTILLSLLVLVLAVVLFVWLQGDRLLRGLIERELQARFAPTVVVEGPVGWTLSTSPALRIANVRFVESGQPVLALSSLVVGADLDALLEGRIVLASVEINGLEMRLRHLDDGRLNLTTWLREDGSDTPATDVPLAVGRLRISDSVVHVDENLTIRIEGFDAGPIRQGVLGQFTIAATVTERSLMDYELQLSIAGMLDPVGRQLEGVTATFRGRFKGRYELSGELGLTAAAFNAGEGIRSDGIAGKLTLTDSSATEASALLNVHAVAGAFSAASGTLLVQGLDLDARIRNEDQSGEVHLSVDTLVVDGEKWDAPGFVLRAASHGALPPATAALFGSAGGALSGPVRIVISQSELELPNPAGESKPIESSLIGALWLDVAPVKVSGDVSGVFDDSRFEGSLAYEHGRVPPISLKLALDRLDLDRYLPPPAQGQAGPDLALWRNWPVSADLAVGELRVQGFLSRDARLRLDGGNPVQQDVRPLPEDFPVAP